MRRMVSPDTRGVNSCEDPFRTVHEALGLFQSCGIDQLSLSINGTVDALEISLMRFEQAGGVNLSVRRIDYFAIHRSPGDDIPLADFRLTTLSPSQLWPPELPRQFVPAATVPPLLWLHGDGAVTFDVIAASVTVLTQVVLRSPLVGMGGRLVAEGFRCDAARAGTASKRVGRLGAAKRAAGSRSGAVRPAEPLPSTNSVTRAPAPRQRVRVTGW